MIGHGFYIILRLMPLAEDIVTSRHRITSYSDHSVSINETVYQQSLILTADSMLNPWPVSSISDLDTDSLAPIFESQPAVVLLGTGPRQKFPEARIFGLHRSRSHG